MGGAGIVEEVATERRALVGALLLLLLADDAKAGPGGAKGVHDGDLGGGVRLGQRGARVVRVLSRGRQRAAGGGSTVLHRADLVAALARGVHARREELDQRHIFRGSGGHRDDRESSGRGGTTRGGRRAGDSGEGMEGGYGAVRENTRSVRAHQVARAVRCGGRRG